jgi:hypothetical protein
MSVTDLPDFDDMYKLIDEIKNLSIEVAKAELEIKVMEGDIFVKGKEDGHPVNHITNAYKTAGFNGELIPFRESLAEKQAELKFKENVLALYRSKIDVWRSVSANERLGIA